MYLILGIVCLSLSFMLPETRVDDGMVVLIKPFLFISSLVLFVLSI